MLNIFFFPFAALFSEFHFILNSLIPNAFSCCMRFLHTPVFPMKVPLGEYSQMVRQVKSAISIHNNGRSYMFEPTLKTFALRAHEIKEVITVVDHQEVPMPQLGGGMQ